MTNKYAEASAALVDAPVTAMRNLAVCGDLLSWIEEDKIVLLAYIHDLFRDHSGQRLAINDKRSASSKAAEYSRGICDDEDLAQMLQWRCEPHVLWTRHTRGGDVTHRLNRLQSNIEDLSLFSLFQVVINCSRDKYPWDSMDWFLFEMPNKRASIALDRLIERVTADV